MNALLLVIALFAGFIAGRALGGSRVIHTETVVDKEETISMTDQRRVKLAYILHKEGMMKLLSMFGWDKVYVLFEDTIEEDKTWEHVTVIGEGEGRVIELRDKDYDILYQLKAKSGRFSGVAMYKRHAENTQEESREYGPVRRTIPTRERMGRRY